MSYAAIGSPLRDPSSPYHAAAVEMIGTMRKAENAAAKITNNPPKIDVIDLSKPPTPEQAERLRNFGILGYGSVSAKKTVTTTTYPDGSSRTVTNVEYKNEFFSAVDEATYQFGLSGSWVSTENGFTVESAANLRKVDWYDDSFHACSFSTKLSGSTSWYSPPKFNEDGTWSLAEYGPSAKISISGYHSALIAAQSRDGQTQFARLEMAAARVEAMLPGGIYSTGGLDLNQISKRVLEQLDQQAALVARYLSVRR